MDGIQHSNRIVTLKAIELLMKTLGLERNILTDFNLDYKTIGIDEDGNPLPMLLKLGVDQGDIADLLRRGKKGKGGGLSAAFGDPNPTPSKKVRLLKAAQSSLVTQDCWTCALADIPCSAGQHNCQTCDQFPGSEEYCFDLCKEHRLELMNSAASIMATTASRVPAHYAGETPAEQQKIHQELLTFMIPLRNTCSDCAQIRDSDHKARPIDDTYCSVCSAFRDTELSLAKLELPCVKGATEICRLSRHVVKSARQMNTNPMPCVVLCEGHQKKWDGINATLPQLFAEMVEDVKAEKWKKLTWKDCSALFSPSSGSRSPLLSNHAKPVSHAALRTTFLAMAKRVLPCPST